MIGKSTFKILVSLLAVLLIPTAAAAASKVNTMNNASFAPLGKDIMPIGAWVAPPPKGVFGQNNPNYITNASYKLAKDVGLNMVYGLYERIEMDPKQVMKALDAAQANGLKYMVTDSAIQAGADDPDLMKDSMQQYMKHPAYIGNLAIDEPSASSFDALGASAKNFKKIAPGSYFYVNLLPSYATKNQLFVDKSDETGGKPSTADYQKYVDQFVSKVKPSFLSYDYYPLEGKFPSLKPGYFENMSVVRKTAEKNRIPFWVFIQTSSWSSGVRLPKPSETFWQVNTALAYGAKGIQYFTFWCPFETGFTGGLVSRTGKKTATYSDVQKMNKQIAAIDQILMNSVSKGVIVYNASPVPVPTADQLKEDKQLSMTGTTPILAGVFDYQGKSAYYVVNNSVDQDGAVTLHFGKSVTTNVYQNAQKTRKSGNELNLKLAAGEGALVVID
ncbi:beta-galactosidase [Cohnella soli]|uniref:Beta-galactosidase n=1 Tax=Cohnella soli TaxID=425005 RepID=A0ABW0HTQ0_9BACL